MKTVTPVTGVTRLAAAPEGGLWIGTRKAKLLRWQNGKLAVWNSMNGLASESIAALFATSRGDVWAAGRQAIKLIHVSGDKPQYVDMPTLHTHNITNTGSKELTTMFWSQNCEPRAWS